MMVLMRRKRSLPFLRHKKNFAVESVFIKEIYVYFQPKIELGSFPLQIYILPSRPHPVTLWKTIIVIHKYYIYKLIGIYTQ